MSATLKAFDITGKELLGEYPLCTETCAIQTFAQAKEAFKTFSLSSIDERIQLVSNLKKIITIRQNEIADAICRSVGKPVTEAFATEIFPSLIALEHLEKNLKSALKKRSVSVPLFFCGTKAYRYWKPSGTTLVISPWNFPFYLALIPCISAIAGGNTVILKISEHSPKVAEVLNNLFISAGFPKNVFQSVYGAKEAVDFLIKQHPDRISFTGSTAIGKIIAEQAGKMLIPCLTELGGNSPMIIYADTNFTRAVNAAAFSAFCNAGQVCIASKRILVQDSIYERFISAFTAKVNSLTLADLGKITLPNHYIYLNELITDAVQKGAKIVCGEISKDSFRPVILRDIKPDMRIMQEEAFGPVVPVMAFDGDINTAARLANDSVYGLSASIFTSNKDKAFKTAALLETGSISINDAISSVAIPTLPFGGVKQSGIGRYHSQEGIRFFTDEIALSFNSGNKNSEALWFNYSADLPDALREICNTFFGKKRNILRCIKALFTLWQRQNRKS